MNWPIKIISKALITKISHISWGGCDKEGLRQRGLQQRLLRYSMMLKCNTMENINTIQKLWIYSSINRINLLITLIREIYKYLQLKFHLKKTHYILK